MAYDSDKKPLELTPITSLETNDTVVVGDTSDTTEVVKSITWSNVKTLIEAFTSYFNVSTDDSDAITEGASNLFLSTAERSAISNNSAKVSYTDAAKVADIEALADVTDTTNVTAAGALMDSEVTNLAQVKAFDTTDYAAALGADDNYVTDAEKDVVGNTSGTNTGDEASASTTVSGVSELTTIAEVDTGTDTTRAVTSDALQGSIRNLRMIDFIVVDPATDVATGTSLVSWSAPFAGTIVQDDTNKDYFAAYSTTAGVTGTQVVDIHKNGTTIMTTNKLDTETGELDTTLATTQPDLTTTTFVAGDVFTIDVDTVHTTAAKGLMVRMSVRPD